MAYGYQLLLDLYGCDAEKCSDLSACYRFLEEMVAHLGMRPMAPPNVFRTDFPDLPHHAGLSGWVPLIESSIVIHTLSVDGYISVDVYSCRPFDYPSSADFVKAFFRATEVETHAVTRGARVWVDRGEGVI
jgi:S-adenosylmethionine decarboxylase